MKLWTRSYSFPEIHIEKEVTDNKSTKSCNYSIVNENLYMRGIKNIRDSSIYNDVITGIQQSRQINW